MGEEEDLAVEEEDHQGQVAEEAVEEDPHHLVGKDLDLRDSWKEYKVKEVFPRREILIHMVLEVHPTKGHHMDLGVDHNNDHLMTAEVHPKKDHCMVAEEETAATD